MNKNIFENNIRFILYILAGAVILIIVLASMHNRYQFSFEVRQNETEVHLNLTPSKEESKQTDENMPNEDIPSIVIKDNE